MYVFNNLRLYAFSFTHYSSPKIYTHYSQAITYYYIYILAIPLMAKYSDELYSGTEKPFY